MSEKANFLLGESSEEESSSNFSLELVVDKAKEGEKAESARENNIYDFDLDMMKDKPWLKPGADITDYFNYGFTEKTWKKYCEMQRENRAFVDREHKHDRGYKDARYDERQDERYYKRRRTDGERYQRKRY